MAIPPLPTSWSDLVDVQQPGIWRYRGLLPVDDSVSPVSLGEGNTPLVGAGRFGDDLGVGSLSFKMESANPTWSHKDRLASLGVSLAAAQGAEAVIVGSSGNQGAAAAAYCARAGLPCIVLTTADIPPLLKLMIQSYGAMLLIVPTFTDRGALLSKSLNQENWFPLSGYADPPIGSHRAAVPAYSSIAFELFEQTNGRLPDAIVVPTSHGDTVAGMWMGFQRLRDLVGLDALPRLIAVEPFGSLERTLAAGSDVPLPGRDSTTRAFSIGGHISTPQALTAVLESGGTGVQIDDEDMRRAYRRLGREGLLVEPSSAMGAAAVATLLDRELIRPHEKAVVLITSSGLKDPSYAQEVVDDVPMIDPDLDDLYKALRTSYGFRS